MTKTKEVEGVKLSKVNDAVVGEYLAKLNLPADGTKEEKVARLSVYLKHKFEEPHLRSRGARCNVGPDACGGLSDSRFDRCPFCGDGAADETVAKVAGGSGEAEAIEQLWVVVQTSPTVKLDPAKRKRRGAAAPTEPAPAPEAEEVGDGPTTGEKPRGKVESPIPEDRSSVLSDPSAIAAAIVAPGGAPDGDVPPPGLVAVEDEKATEKDLDRSVERIRKHVGAQFSSMYDLGLELAENFSRKLWTRRPAGKDHAQAYASWADFVRAELAADGVGVSYSYQLMRLATSCTREVFHELGTAKLRLVFQAPEEDRPALLQAARQSTLSQLREQVHERRTAFPKPAQTSLLPEAGSKKGGEVAAPERVEREPPKPEPRKEREAPKADPKYVATSLKLGRTRLKLYARPARKGDAPKRAKKVADDAYALELLKGGESIAVLEALEKGDDYSEAVGVHVRYALEVGKDGGLVLVIHRSKGIVRTSTS